MAEKSGKDRWDKAEVVAKVFGSLLIPVLIAFFFYAWNENRTEQLTIATNIELAMEILRSPPLEDGSDERLRQWAVSLLQSPSDPDPFPDRSDIWLRYTTTNSILCERTEEFRKELAQAVLADVEFRDLELDEMTEKDRSAIRLLFAVDAVCKVAKE